mgnify:CR=1 FL=1
MYEIVDERLFIADNFCKRLDIFLSEKTGKSRSYCSKLVNEGFVLLNEKISEKPSRKVEQFDRILVRFPREEAFDLTPKQIDFDVVYEHEEYVVINKPAGITVHPAAGNYSDTLVNGLLYKFDIEMGDEDVRPGIVHRLDKNTSGLMIIAKNSLAKQKFSELFSSRKIVKKYKAICYGKPKEDFYSVENKIGRHPVDRKKMAVTEKGRQAKTDVLIMERFKNEFLCEVTIHTGRTHQIRVHMLSLGFPIIGDDLYCNKKSLNYPIDRQSLHAFSLSFVCPFSLQEKIFEIELPEDILSLIAFLKKQ